MVNYIIFITRQVYQMHNRDGAVIDDNNNKRPIILYYLILG